MYVISAAIRRVCSSLKAPNLLCVMLLGMLQIAQGSAIGGGFKPLSSARNYGKVKPYFEKNVGQFPPGVLFVLRAGGGQTLFVTAKEDVWSFCSFGRGNDGKPSAHPDGHVRMRFQGRNEWVRPSSVGLQPGRVNYFRGSDPRKWIRNVPVYDAVVYRGIYPGIDLRYETDEGGLRYSFRLSQNADAERIQMMVDDLDRLEVEKDRATIHIGSRALHLDATSGGTGGRLGFRSTGRNVLSPVSPAGNPTPESLEIRFSTYLGGSRMDEASGIDVDSSGHAYVIGSTFSPDFPASGAQEEKAGSWDVFVTKLNPEGNGIVYSTYLGGRGPDWGQAIAVDSKRQVYVTGITRSTTGFPLVRPVQRRGRREEAFIAKLNAKGSNIVFSTYFGGFIDDDEGLGIAVDSRGFSYSTGITCSRDFPLKNSTQPIRSCDGYVVKMSPHGALVYSVAVGGSGIDVSYAIQIGPDGGIYITGQTRSKDFPTTVGAFQRKIGDKGAWSDAFITKIDQTDARLVFSTYLGGSRWDAADSIALDVAGNVYVGGSTCSRDFPTKRSIQEYRGARGGTECDGFFSKLSARGSSLLYSTYFGTASDPTRPDVVTAVGVDTGGNMYLAGQSAHAGQNWISWQPFAAILNKPGTTILNLLDVHSLVGDANNNLLTGMKVDTTGNIYLTGTAYAPNFPTVDPFQTNQPGCDAFVTKLSRPGK